MKNNNCIEGSSLDGLPGDRIRVLVDIVEILRKNLLAKSLLAA